MDGFPKVSKRLQKCQKSAVLENKKKVYHCKLCDYKSSHKSHFDKHLKSKKHQKKGFQKVSKRLQKSAVLFKCEYCKKEYKTKSGFWKHQQKCKKKENVEELNEIDVLKQIVHSQNETMKEVKNALLKSYPIQNTTNNIQKQENYNTININIFLNEHCKNAMNLQDFVDKIKYKLDDVMAINALGYEKGMANVMLKNLKDMPVTERPIHCSDSKEGVFHVKDEGEWHQEKNGLDPGSKTYAIAKQLRTKGILAIKEWEAANPNWPYDDKLGKERLCLFDILAGGCDAKELENSHIEFLKKVGDEVKIEDAINEIN
jgi:hypothetical protein|tara:strand:- start:147 stop:1091 length:945 start_codon:yes stop_codon:yes gene_type:complete